MQLVGKLRYGIGTFDFRTNSDLQRDQLAHDHDNTIFEAAYSIRPTPGITMEAGKRVLRWGKGYAWNPIGFVERLKDPNDPELTREGFVMAASDLIFNPGGNLQTIAFTPVLLPVGNDVNSDFGSSGHLNPAAKLYLLYRDTDIDFAWQGRHLCATWALSSQSSRHYNLRILGVSGMTLNVQGLDTIDGTPVLDIKPYMTEFGPRGEILQPG
jgi:hypothetical protein